MESRRKLDVLRNTDTGRVGGVGATLEGSMACLLGETESSSSPGIFTAFPPIFPTSPAIMVFQNRLVFFFFCSYTGAHISRCPKIFRLHNVWSLLREGRGKARSTNISRKQLTLSISENLSFNDSCRSWLNFPTF